MLDTIVQNAQIVDGSGAPGYIADVAIAGDRIADIGNLSAATSETVIDGTGLIAAPGFIDMHSHSDFTLPINPRAESKVRQGITSEVIGQCGSSAAPLDATLREIGRAHHPDLSWDWNTFGEYLDCLERTGLAVNIVPLVGHGTVRGVAMGLADRSPSGAELADMKRLLIQAMDEGAWGISTGLIYPPGVYASTDELVELSHTVAEKGGYYFSHIRGEGKTLLKAVAEAIEIGERADLPVQIAHLKAAGPENWTILPQALELIDNARARGVDVAADRYPYTAASNSLADQLPAWAHDGGPSALLERLRHPDTRQRMLAEARTRRWDQVLVAFSPSCPELEGMTVAAIAAQRGVSPDEAVPEILLEAELRISIISFAMSEDNLRTVLRHPAVMIGTDGSARAPEGPLGQGKSHPRSYGTFPRVLGKYVREEGVLSLPEAVRKMTGLPAERLRLPDRGRLAKGMKADLVLFDPQTVIDKATYMQPYQYPVGISYVFVNGQAVITPAGHTGALPGQILRKAN